MPERIEVIETATGLTRRRFGARGAVTGGARLLELKTQLAALIAADPALQKYRAGDLTLKRVDIYADDQLVKDDDPERPDPTVKADSPSRAERP